MFIDSNVLLHYRFFDELDWTTLIKADEVVLTICAPVIRELDRKKWSGHSSRGAKSPQVSARSSIRNLIRACISSVVSEDLEIACGQQQSLVSCENQSNHSGAE